MIVETRECENIFSTSYFCFVDELCRVNEMATFRIVRRIYRCRVCATNRRSSLFLVFHFVFCFFFFLFYPVMCTTVHVSIWMSVGIFSTNSNFAHSLCMCRLWYVIQKKAPGAQRKAQHWAKKTSQQRNSTKKYNVWIHNL